MPLSLFLNEVVVSPCKTCERTHALGSLLVSTAEFYLLRRFESIDVLSANEKGEESKKIA